LQPQCRELGRVDLNAHGGLLLAADRDLRDARNLRNLLPKDVLGVIVDGRDREDVRMNCENENGRIGRIDLAVGGRRRQVLRQLTARRVDAGLHVLRCRVDVAIQIELQRDLRGAEHVGRCHLRQTGNLRELIFERRCDGGGHGFRARARKLGGDQYGRKVHLRQGCHRQQRKHDESHQKNASHQQ
jgi:hypothetical protein